MNPPTHLVSRLLRRADKPTRRRPGPDPIGRLERSLARGVAVPEESAPWRPRPRHDDPVGLYAPFRAGGLFDHDAGDLGAVLEASADHHKPTYRRGREELHGRLRSLGVRGFLTAGGIVAVSHPRRPIVLPVAEPTIAVCLADEPVPLGPGDGPGVRGLLALVCPSVSYHLDLLARLSRLLADDRFVRLLAGGYEPEEILDFVWLRDCGLADDEVRVPSDPTGCDGR